MTRFFLLFLLICGALFLTPLPARAAKLRVAMILPGSDTDKGWNQMAAEGLQKIKKDLDADTRLSTNVQAADFYTRMGDFAEDGYDVVICHGGEFEKAAAKAAAAYPKTRFIVGGCPNDIPGAVSIDFLTRDASQLVGLVAAEVSQSKTVAFVGADPVAPVQACYDGMSDGIKASGQSVQLLPALWTNSWDSLTVAREKAQAAIASGADVIYQNVDAAALGVFQAVQDANKSGKKIAAFGCNSNQNAVAPDVILGSVVLDIQGAYTDLVRDARDGKLKNGPVKLGLPHGYVDLVLNDKHPLITAGLREKVAALRKKLAADKK
jgi:basic membrane lipoprotein Med (substrate-binding protein (PBP1-ABC) superfamily)